MLSACTMPRCSDAALTLPCCLMHLLLLCLAAAASCLILTIITTITTSAAGSSSSSSSGGGVGSYLLSLDAEGWVGLWDCSSWVCLDMTRAAPLPPGCSPTLLLMVRGGWGGGVGGGNKGGRKQRERGERADEHGRRGEEGR
jgi:hypothetical protein